MPSITIVRQPPSEAQICAALSPSVKAKIKVRMNGHHNNIQIYATAMFLPQAGGYPVHGSGTVTATGQPRGDIQSDGTQELEFKFSNISCNHVGRFRVQITAYRHDETKSVVIGEEVSDWVEIKSS